MSKKPEKSGLFWYTLNMLGVAVGKTATRNIYSDKPCASPDLPSGNARGFHFRWNMIIRNRKRHGYTKISNKAVQDKRLSYGARGVLTYLLSKPDNWEIKTQDIINNSPAGRTAVLAMLRELEDYGYLQRKVTRNAGGTFDWEVNLYEEPESGFPPTVDPSTDNPPVYREPENREESPAPAHSKGRPIVPAFPDVDDEGIHREPARVYFESALIERVSVESEGVQ